MLYSLWKYKLLLILIILFFVCSIICQIVPGVILSRLLEETENMAATKNRPLKQCRLKYINCCQLNGRVVNTGIFCGQVYQKAHFFRDFAEQDKQYGRTDDDAFHTGHGDLCLPVSFSGWDSVSDYSLLCDQYTGALSLFYTFWSGRYSRTEGSPENRAYGLSGESSDAKTAGNDGGRKQGKREAASRYRRICTGGEQA